MKREDLAAYFLHALDKIAMSFKFKMLIWFYSLNQNLHFVLFFARSSKALVTNKDW